MTILRVTARNARIALALSIVLLRAVWHLLCSNLRHAGITRSIDHWNRSAPLHVGFCRSADARIAITSFASEKTTPAELDTGHVGAVSERQGRVV